MDTLFLAMSLFHRRKFEQAVERLNEVLEKNPYDKAAWTLKMRALTEELYIDEVENDDEGIAEMLLDDSTVAAVPRPGTSLRVGTTASGGPSPAVRPMSKSGRPVSGFLRPGTNAGRPGTMDQALKTARTLSTARPVTAASGRHVRLGTASMVSSADGPFINLSRLNYNKYAGNPALAKPLFEYILYHENDVRNALELAALSTEKAKHKDWWWKIQLGKCYHRLGMFRDAEAQYKSSLKQHVTIDGVLLLAKVYLRLDQPLQAISTYKQGLLRFAGDSNLQAAVARAHEGMNQVEEATKWYKDVLDNDGVNVEAIASIAANYFYTDQPEVAIRLYRRLLMMGVCSVELFNNLGLCCYFSQHYDMTLKCFERALALCCDDEKQSDIWYNVSHLAMGIGDNVLAYQCLRLAISCNNSHSEAYNNLAAFELRRGDTERARALLGTSCEQAPMSYEPHYNLALLSESVGDLQTSYQFANKSIEAFPNHADSNALLKRLGLHLSSIS